MASPRHGKEAFGWCDSCGTIILGRECSSCRSPLRTFSVSLPADIRPCMGDSMDLVMGLFQRYFGTSGFLEGRLVLLNRIAGLDRADEIVVEGMVLGILRFDPVSRAYGLDLNLDGAKVLAPLATRNLVRMDGVRGHLKGRNLPGSAISSIKGEFEPGHPLVVLAGNLICAGTARVSSRDARTSDHAIKVRDVGKGRVRLPPRDLNWLDMVRCNQVHLRRLASRAISEVHSYLEGRGTSEVTVSFSGGKDSLACYGIARRATSRVTLLFANTGLEFPETVDYVREFAAFQGLELIEAAPTSTFWEQLPSFGPPAKDFRWCCKVCKLAPITSIIEDRFPCGVISLVGNRVYESFTRSRIGLVEKNPFVPGQVNLNPVRDWRAVEIWGYIWMEGLPYNPLYNRDMQRIGCYLCPASLASEWEATRVLHPELHSRWEGWLEEWLREKGADHRFVECGLWRWKSLPPKMREVVEDLGITLPVEAGDRIELRMVRGASPCSAGGQSVEGVLSLPVRREFGAVVEALKALGPVKYSEEYQIAMVRRGEATLKVFGGGQATSVAPTAEMARELFELGLRSMLRGRLCSGCGICLRSCPVGAIELADGLRIDQERCTHCGRCIQACVVAHYFDKLVDAG